MLSAPTFPQTTAVLAASAEIVSSPGLPMTATFAPAGAVKLAGEPPEKSAVVKPAVLNSAAVSPKQRVCASACGGPIDRVAVATSAAMPQRTFAKLSAIL